MILIGILALVFAGCVGSTEEPLTPEQWLEQQLAKVDQAQLVIDTQVIDDSLALWDSTNVLMEPNGVRYIIQETGNGIKPVLSSVITVKYSGKFLSTPDVEFDGSDNLVYPLYNLILGWQTTLPLLPVGTKATLYIPSGLAYGKAGVVDPGTGDELIPPNANLIFEIELNNAQ
jgi:FKBP-type peptidyl-prolyl cis-trans isomerase